MSRLFQITKTHPGTRARLGILTTPRGKIETPIFMPVGTQGTVKAMRPEELVSMGAQIILGNTYHLYLRPGHQLIAELGGLHHFMNWKGPILTDSGGFQVYSLGREASDRNQPQEEVLNLRRENKLAKITDEGVEFLSHIDGSRHFMTPELSIQIQQALGSDIMMSFDDCTPYPATHQEAQKSLDRSMSWELRSLKARTTDQALFAIAQGGLYADLRQQCFDRLFEMNRVDYSFDGYALGGLSVGEPIPEMYSMVDVCVPMMPANYPRYLMGVGLPEDLITCIDLGIDMFDCVVPTRNARNGMLFTQEGYIYIKQKQFTKDPSPIDETCSCYTCQHYSRAYLRHLHLAKEILSSILSSIHNLHYYLNLLSDVRLSLKEGSFLEFKKQFFSRRNT